MTTVVRPRALVHVGHLPAAGVLLDERLLGPEALRRRALALWEPGVRLLQVPGGLLVRFPRPRVLDAGAAPGHLVAAAGGVLATAPLEPRELEALAPPAGAVVTVRGGEAVALLPGRELDPSDWLELDAAVVAVESLGEPPAPPPAPPAPPGDVRALLSAPALSAEARTFAAALRAGEGRRGAGTGVAAALAAGVGLAALTGLERGLSALGTALRALAGGGGHAGAGSAALLAPPSPPGRLVRALRRLRDRLAVATRVAHLAGRRQGAYIGRLLSLFERGELDEALRRAVPLAGAGGGEAHLALGVPGARDRLEIHPAVSPGGAVIPGAPDLYAEMQRLYRRAFQLLDARGDHERAAFVLAELLRADEEAVSYLERHGRLRLAAELAEGRGLPPGLAVRQWFLAGDVERAVALARARGAYADAVDRLERSRRADEAQALRLLWAEDLASAGDLEAAVRVARPVPRARTLVLRWVELGVAAGGPAGHALLPLLLELDPGRFPEVRSRALDACQDPGDDGPLRRAALARGLRAAAPSGAIRVLARSLVRARVIDRERGLAEPAEEPALLALAADGALEADLPSPAQRPRRTAPAALNLTIAGDDAGTRPATDAAALPGGRILVALGEAGAVLLSRGGREVARFDVPASRLVVSDSGTRALALGPRGEAVHVSRLDLDARTAAPVRDLRLRAYARSYDGTAWLAATEDAVVLLDVLRDDLRALWRVGGLPGPAACLERDARAFTFVTLGEEVEGWRYELPDLTLRARAGLEPARAGEALRLLHGGGAHPWFTVVAREDGLLLLRAASAQARHAHVLGPDGRVLGLAGGRAVAVALLGEGEVSVQAVELAGDATSLPVAVSLQGAHGVSLRAAGDALTIADDRGRVLVIDVSARRLTHDLRV